MKNVIAYIGIILLTVYVEIMYVQFYGTTLLAFEILLFLAMFLLSWYFRRSVTAGLKVRIPAAQKGEEIRVELEVKNRGVLPVTKMDVFVEAENCGIPRGTRTRVTASVPARGQGREICLTKAEYCGRYHFRMAKGRVWDYLGLFSRKIRCREDAYVNVMPEFCLMAVDVSEYTRNFPADSEEYDPHRSGDDPSEIFQIREFRDGDTLQRVHWKMSAKADELMTKELGRPVGYCVLLLVDFHVEKQEKGRMERLDAIFELAAAVSYSLREAGVYHLAAWYDEKQGSICRAHIRKEEQVYEMIDRLLGAGPYEQNMDLLQAYQEEYPGGQFGSILRLDMRPALSVNDREAVRFETDHLKEQILGCLLEV